MSTVILIANEPSPMGLTYSLEALKELAREHPEKYYVEGDKLLLFQSTLPMKAASAQLAQMTAAHFGPSRADDLWSELRKEIHALALAKGLPEVEGFYGMDNDGQFIKAG